MRYIWFLNKPWFLKIIFSVDSTKFLLKNGTEFWKVFSWYDVKIRYLESHPKGAVSTILIRLEIKLAAIKMIKIFSQLVLFSRPRCWNHIQRLVISLMIDSLPAFFIHFRSSWLNRVTRSTAKVESRSSTWKVTMKEFQVQAKYKWIQKRWRTFQGKILNGHWSISGFLDKIVKRQKQLL